MAMRKHRLAFDVRDTRKLIFVYTWMIRPNNVPAASRLSAPENRIEYTHKSCFPLCVISLHFSFIFSMDARQYYVQSCTVHPRSLSGRVRLQSVCGVDRSVSTKFQYTTIFHRGHQFSLSSRFKSATNFCGRRHDSVLRDNWANKGWRSRARGAAKSAQRRILTIYFHVPPSNSLYVLFRLDVETFSREREKEWAG